MLVSRQSLILKYLLFFGMIITPFVLLCTQNGCGKKFEQLPTMVVDSKGNVTRPVLDLLKILNVYHDGSLGDIVSTTQKLWIRTAGTELWHVQDAYQDKADKIISIFKEIGCVDSVYPQQKEYDYLLFLGASLWTLRIRLASIVKWWNNGIRFKKIVFLTGQRELDAAIETNDALLNVEGEILANRADWQAPENLPIMETDMMNMVYDQADIPQDMRDALSVVVIDSLQRILPDGRKSRPRTDETIISWLETNPLPGSCLVVSNQPHLWRQHAVLKTLLSGTFRIESAGDGIDPKQINCSSFLDMIARWLYQENEYTKKVIKK